MVKSGDRVGAYEIIAPLGAGGMGVLFRARDPRLNREVAIKFLADKHSASDERLKRFDREARAASALNHPHIITVYEIGEHDSRPFIAMELVEGKSLRQLLTEGTLSMRKLLTLAGQIADGLAAAHDKGIVHRDLKPENVMITKTGYVKLLDFGLAKLEPETVGPEDDTAKHELITTPGLVMGTAAYMSPEQARGHVIDYRSDQFSFGAMLYEMMTGKRPFTGSTPIDLIGSIVYQHPEKVSNLNPRVPNSVEWIIERCLQKDRDDRYESTADLAREIELARDRMSDATPSAPLAPLAKMGSTAKVVAVGVLAVVLAAAAIGVWFAIRRDAQPAREAGDAKQETIYLAVEPFRDVSPEPLSPSLGDGFAQTISARLGGSGSVRLMEGRRAESGVARSDDPRVICRELGANRLLRGSLQRSGETLRVTYTITDAGGIQIAGDAVEGRYTDLFAIQDQLAEQILKKFGGAASPPGRLQAADAFQQDRYLEAVGHLVRGENPASVDGAIEILSGLGDSPMVLATLSRAFLAKRMITDDPKYGTLALDTCQRALASGERSAEIYTTLGEVKALVGQQQEAVDAFRAALAVQPDDEAAMLGLANALADGGKDKEAGSAYARAIALRPNLWISHNQLGVFHLVRGRYDEAIRAFNSALALTPDNIRVLNNLGATYQQMGRHEEALGMYARSLAERPNADAYSNRGTCLFFMGRYDESADAYERATALNPDSWIIWTNLGDAYRWSSTRTTKAAAAYRRAIELGEDVLALRPRDGNLLSMLATTYAKLGDRRRATSLASMAVEVAPADAYALYAAGVAFEVAGSRERAVGTLIAALDRGYSAEEMSRDPELEKVRKDKALAARLDAAQARTQGRKL